MRTRTPRLFILILIGTLLSSCLGTPAPTPVQNDFIPLPIPVMGRNKITLAYNSLATDSQSSELFSPLLSYDYFQYDYQGSTDNSNAASGEFTAYAVNRRASFSQADWNDWQDGSIRVIEYYGADQKLLGGMVGLSIDGTGFIQWLTRGFEYTLDRSEIYLIYQVQERGTVPVLSQVLYREFWGTSDDFVWAMGLNAVWDESTSVLSSEYSQWGFWETSRTPFDTVTSALGNVRSTLQTSASDPDFMLRDEDSVREFLGRQTAFQMYTQGEHVGEITFDFDHNFGRAPNTRFIGSGALSAIRWTFDSGQEYTLIALTPEVSTVPTTLYIFCASSTCVNTVHSVSQWVNLYPMLREGSVPDVLFAVHVFGDLKTATTDISASVSGGEGSIETTADLGNAGGIIYTGVGDYSHEHIEMSFELLQLLGKGGLKALGLYFPYRPGSGSGLAYYLGTLVIVTSPEEEILLKWGADIGVFDRTGFINSGIIVDLNP